MRIKIAKQRSISVVAPEGEISRIEDCMDLSRRVNEQIASNAGEVILDLKRVAFVTASFCGFLVSMARRAKKRKKHFCLVVDPASKTYEMLCLVGMNGLVDMQYSSSGSMGTPEEELK